MELETINTQNNNEHQTFFNYLDFSKKIILVTAHRRESFGRPFQNICSALKQIAETLEDVEIIYPMHLNPNARKAVTEILKDIKRIHLIEPLEYLYFIWLMQKSYLILTD